MPLSTTRLALTFLLPAALWAQTVTGPSVRFHTTLGDIDVTLLPDAAPQTVANFLSYVNNGSYNNTIVHRSVPGFIWQAGGYQLINHAPALIPQASPVVNEYKLSNTRGTIAMAKLGSSPNSATDQWFFNLADNSANLNGQNGGFTVFGRVANSASLAIMDKVALQPTYDESATLNDSAFTNLPLVGFSGALQDSNYVLVTSIVQLAATAASSAITASGFGAFPGAAAPGSYIEIYGTNLAGTTRGWGSADFVNGNAPTTLDNVTVTIAGQRAYVNYVSPTQVNVQIPASVSPGPAVPVITTYNGTASPALQIVIQALEPGLLAPASFNIAGVQYAVAINAAAAVVSNGNIPGFPAAPAASGDVLTFYGIGFGPVTQSNAPAAGQVSQGQTTLSASVQFNIGGVLAQVTYAGFAPGLVGVDQFNVVVPPGLTTGDQPLQVLVNGTAIPQTLWLPVK